MPTLPRPARPWAAGLLLLAAGCGPARYPVEGTVEYGPADPFTAKGRIVAEPADPDNPVSAVGPIDAAGRFRLYTLNPGDGVRPGRYRVSIQPAAQTPGQSPKRSPHLDARFAEFDTSGLEIDVGPRANRVTLTVARPAKAPKPLPPEE